ncbi:MAG TPA: hypothetical protein DCO86_01225 [Spirochaetaceae bacterium]|nr:hypothetical protein [Spirochaetaceae bacterium]
MRADAFIATPSGKQRLQNVLISPKRILIIILSALSIGCEYGLFNKYYPNRSEIIAYIDGDMDSLLSKSKMLAYSIEDDKMNGKFIRLEAMHLRGDEKVKGGFLFESDSVSFTASDDRTITIPLDRIRTLGVHEIEITSKLDKAFDHKFLICATTPMKSFEAQYSISQAFDLIDYEGSDSGSFRSNDCFSKPIRLISASTYLFSLTSGSEYKIPTTDFLSKNPEIMRFEKESDTQARLIIGDDAAGKTGALSISVRNSGIEATVPVLIDDIASISIREREHSDIKTETIFVKDPNVVKEYSIDLSSASNQSRRFQAYFTRQSNSEDISEEISSDMQKEILAQSNEYFSISFDGASRKISVNTKKQTVKDGRNLYFYIYVFDDAGKYFGRWRVLCGGETESVEFEEKEVRTKTQTSSSTLAKLVPDDDSKTLLWYLSKSKGEIGNPPMPLEKEIQDSLISFIDKYPSAGTIRLGDTSYNASAYSFGMTQGQSHAIHWTTGGEAASLYLVAASLEGDAFCSMPFLISADSGIVLKSADPISNKKASEQNYEGNWKEFEDSLHPIDFPNGQSYPETYLKGEFGQNTRTFYLPHNKISRIRMETVGIRSLTVSPTSQSSKLLAYDLFGLEECEGYALEITPIWLDLNNKFKNGRPGAFAPAQNPDSGPDAYGKVFYQYIGKCALELKAFANAESGGESKIKIRIVLFENT